jgi:hypothetical protein
MRVKSDLEQKIESLMAKQTKLNATELDRALKSLSGFQNDLDTFVAHGIDTKTEDHFHELVINIYKKARHLTTSITALRDACAKEKEEVSHPLHNISISELEKEVERRKKQCDPKPNENPNKRRRTDIEIVEIETHSR